VIRRAMITAAVLSILVSLTVASASGAGLRPWWHLTSGARPTYLHSGAARDEVAKLTVSATGGHYVLKHGSEERTLVPGATSAQVRIALEHLYGTGNVEVTATGGPPSEVYEVTFVGAIADRFVSVFAVNAAVTGGLEEVDVEQAVQGQPDGEIVAFAENLGDASVNGAGTPVHLRDTLPEHVRAVGVTAVYAEGNLNVVVPLPCTVESESAVSCTFTSVLVPYEEIEMRIAVEVDEEAHPSEENEITVSGGEAPEASLSRALTISGEATPFGVEDYELVNEEVGGAPDRQAGSHPFQQTTTIDVNQLADTNPLENEEHKAKVDPPALAKDLSFRWPPGLIGNPTSVPRCTLAQFLTVAPPPALAQTNECPADSAVGVASVTIEEPALISTATFTEPLFNLEPLPGEPARFGFDVVIANAPVYIDPALRSGSDYGITVSSNNITQTAAFLSARVTVWGVPGAPEHAAERGWGCLIEIESRGTRPDLCTHSEEQHPPAFLSLPTSCTGPSLSTVEGDSWTGADERQQAHLPRLLEPLAQSELPGLVGCNRLPFAPEVKVKADGEQTSKPTGLDVDVHVPQEGQLNGAGLAQSAIRDITVTLPEGVTLNPSAADGLQGCSESQIGYEPGHSSPPSELQFTPRIESPFCPDASKVGEVTIKTPLLPAGQPLKGFVYLASPQNFQTFPQENPFGTHVAMYIVAEDPVSGSLVKLPGRVTLNETTGQIESTFENTPQLAFEDAEVHFFGGERAPLATPSHCGTYTTNATFTPWSGGQAVHGSSSFQVTSGPNGSVCPGASLPFAPSLSSGTTNNNAGSFSDLTTTLSRPDGNQNISSVTLHYPAGLSGLLSSVKLCGEAEANAGTCGPESEIGETIVSVGVGGDPFTVTGGKVYITEKYDGAPFGLSIVNPAKAGPFNLQEGRPVVVRAKIEVDPLTTALTITTDPSGSHVIPTIIEGFPLQIQHVNVLVNRPGFTFNPTNCNPTAITGMIASAEGANSPVAVPFQVTNCASLKFEPKFSVSTSGKTSKAKGASLTARVAYPNATPGSYANITKVKVELPKSLPSRLTTLQKACTNAQFELNPANCPVASKIGYAIVHTPLLPVPLEGPVIFVSHGGEAFPSLTMVLQGYGVTVDLVGTTFISKSSVTSTTFKTVPDQPFSSFELTLPEGPYSALTANGNLCTSKLIMPSEFVGQNGAEFKQNTPIVVSNCPDTISLISHHIKGRTLTLSVYVPTAGKLKTSGKGLRPASKPAYGRGTVTLTLKEHKTGRLHTRLLLSFTSNTGKKQTRFLTIQFKK
jgi:hypothetical protein